ncbi:hypothetical protein B0H13DRAFT_2347805 [Mycena leptocephala]|nr:hypothetical protein B0H13DRAFT_2347805 [Mycena leptocephala]
MTATTTVVPRPPFDDVHADTILRASDGVDFRVYRRFLSIASPFFKDMFSIPQPASEPDVPVIPVAEPSGLLDRVLRVWYPGAELIIDFNGLDQLIEIIELVVSKYDIEFYIDSNPLAVYAIACRYRWVQLAQAAAKKGLNLSIPSLIQSNPTQHLMHIPAHHYQALLLYHNKCGEAASGVGSLLPWSKSSWVWISCTTCAAYTLEYDVPGLPTRRTPRAWIFDYVDRASALLKDAPGASLSDLAFLAPTHAKAAVCRGPCAGSGFANLVTFIHEEYIPKVKKP